MRKNTKTNTGTSGSFERALSWQRKKFLMDIGMRGKRHNMKKI